MGKQCKIIKGFKANFHTTSIIFENKSQLKRFEKSVGEKAKSIKKYSWRRNC